MANLTCIANLPTRGADVTSMKAAVAATFYQGSVALFAANGITNAVTSGLPFAGIVAETKTAAVGDEIAVVVGGEVGLPTDKFAASDCGTLCYVDVSALSNNPADLVPASAAGTGDVPIGQIQAYNLNGKVFVNLGIRAIAAAHA